jgi:hypothetical protein
VIGPAPRDGGDGDADEDGPGGPGRKSRLEYIAEQQRLRNEARGKVPRKGSKEEELDPMDPVRRRGRG